MTDFHLTAILLGLYWRLNNNYLRRDVMQICPVSYAVGCAKCPIFKMCPAKNLIGDAKKEESEKDKKAK
tara:strand:+ start:18759 stop:18965 length:207 start_codon:yes stop_codon:yes gene_type:complete